MKIEWDNKTTRRVSVNMTKTALPDETGLAQFLRRTASGNLWRYAVDFGDDGRPHDSLMKHEGVRLVYNLHHGWAWDSPGAIQVHAAWPASWSVTGIDIEEQCKQYNIPVPSCDSDEYFQLIDLILAQRRQRIARLVVDENVSDSSLIEEVIGFIPVIDIVTDAIADLQEESLIDEG